MAQILRKIPEVVSIQTYAGTAKPFDFNGLVRHSYLRQRSSEGEMQIQLADAILWSVDAVFANALPSGISSDMLNSDLLSNGNIFTGTAVV
jgi:hypothetical protein